jgi:predicted ATPase
MARKRNHISGISVQGFKSISSKQHIAIRPLTVLAGANSAGKSSAMQPLLLLKQTLEAAGDPGSLLLNGENVKFTRADQLLARGSGEKFSVGIELSDGQTLGLTFRKAERGFDLKEMSYGSHEESFTVVPSMSHDAIMKVLPKPWKTMHREVGKDEKLALEWTVRRERCFFVFEMTSPEDGARRVRFGPFGVSPSQSFVSHIEGIIHLPGLRGNPRRTYPKTAGGPSYQGTFEPYVASVIAEWQSSGVKGKLNELAHSLETMALTWKVKAEPVDDTQVELKVGRLPHALRSGAHDLVSIADVGFGVSQTLPVVVALLAARSGQMVYLEQPEIHLHPLAQRRLAKVLQDAVGRGVVVVVETHSAILLRELQTLIAVGELSKDDVAMHWLARNEQGETTVTTAELDDNGAYGKWPEDFDDTELQAEQAYLDAVESKEAHQ